MALNPKQSMFCREYLVDLNGCQAAIRAGYSKKTAQEQSSRLLSNVKVQKEVQKQMAKRAEKVELTAESILRDIMLIKADAMAISDSGTMIDRPSALKASELEGRHLKMFTDKLEHSGDIGVIALTDEQIEAKLARLMEKHAPEKLLPQPPDEAIELKQAVINSHE